MEVTSVSFGPIEIVRPARKFDGEKPREFLDWLHGRVKAGTARILVDLGGVRVVDSSSLSALLDGQKQTWEAGGDLRLCSVPPGIHSIFELTRLAKYFRFDETEDEALADDWPTE